MNERVNECISRSIFNVTRTGNGFNKIMSTGDGFKKVIMYILPSRQEREILVEATRSSDQLNILPKRTALSSFSYIKGQADL